MSRAAKLCSHIVFGPCLAHLSLVFGCSLISKNRRKCPSWLSRLKRIVRCDYCEVENGFLFKVGRLIQPSLDQFAPTSSADDHPKQHRSMNNHRVIDYPRRLMYEHSRTSLKRRVTNSLFWTMNSDRIDNGKLTSNVYTIEMNCAPKSTFSYSSHEHIATKMSTRAWKEIFSPKFRPRGLLGLLIMMTIQ